MRSRESSTNIACALQCAWWLLSAGTVMGDPPAELTRWLAPQVWHRDLDRPVLTLGGPGEFDDTHIFAPTVARDKGKFLMWYCGSQGFAHDLSPMRTRDERVFRLGLATSEDGRQFTRHQGPVLSLVTPRLSVLTPSVLRDAGGNVLLEGGKMRMWFTSATLGGGGQPHAIQQATSLDVSRWSDISQIQIQRAYAPSVLKSELGYEIWYTQPGRYPWVIRHGRSHDGIRWTLTEKPVLEISQPWEHDLQIYPCLLYIDRVYLMWYASYLDKNHLTTGIGFAASMDGIRWHKHPDNPVLRPEAKRDWESHYVSSHSVMQLDDGSFRIWYASRKQPPFQNLYFALNTARWVGLK